MFKFKKLWIIITLILTSTVTFGASVYYITKDSQTTFADNGYVLLTTPNSESEKIYFNRDQRYSKSIHNGISFTDSDNNKRIIPSDSFFHLGSSYTMAMQPGIFMDLSEAGNTYITHYQTQEGALFSKEGKYVLKSNGQGISFSELVWKMNDDRYIILGEDITAHFGEDDVRKCGDYVELHYLDRGVVQIVTEDNIWQTVSSSVFIRTKNKIDIYPVEERIYNPELELNSFLNTLVVDSDDNMHLRNDQEANQIIPKFNITTEDGKDGESGEGGEGGEGGNKGSTGAWGADAGTTSSSKTEIPTMNITQWDMTANSLGFAVQVTDTSDALSGNIDDYEVYLTEKNSSTKIVLVQANYNATNKTYTQNNGNGIFTDEQTLYYMTRTSDLLKPDTEYALVIRGKYSMGSYNTATGGTGTETNMIRDFVYRTFYTNSLGLMLSNNTAKEDSITIDVVKNDYSVADQATVFLMKPEQSVNFTKDTATGVIGGTITGYYKKTVTFGANDSIKTVQFGGLDANGNPDTYNGQITSNTRYVAMVLIEYADGTQVLKSLSKQKLNVSTLKKTPVASGIPTVASNRQLRTFEIYGATVSDPDKAIKTYRFEVHSNSAGTVVKTLEIPATDYDQKGYVNLYIDDKDIKFNEDYYVIQSFIYNDNEKDVEINVNSNSKLMQSTLFSMTGTPLPSVYFKFQQDQQGNNTGLNYERINGYIVISKNGTNIKVDDNHRITIAIESEGVYSKSLSYSSSAITENNSEILIHIDENSLNQNKIYRFTVSAYVDVNDDGNANNEVYTNTVLGSVVVSTPNSTTIRANWSATANTAHTISRTLKLVPAVDGESIDYEKGTISEVNIDLYSGTASSGTKIASVKLSDTNQEKYESTLNYLFDGDGYEISEATFGLTGQSLNATAYSFVISAAYDYTIAGNVEGNVNGYVNQFTINGNDSGTVGRTQQPPNLPDFGQEDTCVSVISITKKSAEATYGVDIDDNLDDNAIVGYWLKANYDDFGRLARSVVYYGFEANYFNSKIANVNPEDISEQRLFQVEIPVVLNSGTIPSVVVWFGSDPNNEKPNLEVFKIGNQDMFYAGNAVFVDSASTPYLQSGMDRGYKYIFSYRMHYSSSGGGVADKLYPRDHPEYGSWNLPGGGHPQLSLHSEVQSAPKTMPVFETYPLYAGGGVLNIKYRYEDTDSVLISEQGTPNTSGYRAGTEFLVNGSVKTDRNGKNLMLKGDSQTLANLDASDHTSAASIWDYVDFTGVTADSNNIVKVTMKASPYQLTYATDPNNPEDTEILVYKTPWQNNLNTLTSGINIKLDASSNYILANKLQIIVDGFVDSDTDKLVGVKLLFTEKDNVPNPTTFDSFVTLDKNGAAYTGSVLLSEFAAYLGKEFKVKAFLVYDSGAFGWGISENDKKMNFGANATIARTKPYYALQKATIENGQGTFGDYYSKYVNTNGINNDSQYPINSRFQTSNWKSVVNDKTNYYLTAYYQGVDNSILSLSYRNSNLGMVLESNPDIAIISKHLLEQEVTTNFTVVNPATADEKTVKIDSIVPSGSFARVRPTLSSADVVDLKIYGFDQIKVINGKTYLYAELYEMVGSQISTTYKERKTVELTGEAQNTTISFANLEEGKEYVVKFKIVLNSNGREVEVLDKNSVQGLPLQASFTTQGSVTISGVTMQFNNLAYNNKKLNLRYYISQFLDVYAKYEIGVKDSNSDYHTLYTYEDMLANGMVVPNGNVFSSNNAYETFDLSPGKYSFIPGQEYIFKIRMYSSIIQENGSDKLVSSSDTDYKFVYPLPSQPISLVSITPTFTESGGTTIHGIEFSVSAIGDKDFAVISKYTPAQGSVAESRAESGDYFVRIYKRTQLATSIIDTLVTGKDITYTVTGQNGGASVTQTVSLEDFYNTSFIENQAITSATISGLEQETNYRVVVYAAIDKNMNGKNDAIEANTTYEAYQMYSASNILTDITAKNRFDGVAPAYDGDSAFRRNYALVSSEATTPDATGVSIGNIGVRANPNNSSQLRLVYYNSSNLSRLTRVIVSVVHRDGNPSLSPVDGVIDIVPGSSVFQYDNTTNRWYFDIPLDKFVMTKNGDYQVIIEHYYGDILVKKYSDYYEKS